ncbi:unnamed protein product, partial [Candidula unifasciata]
TQQTTHGLEMDIKQEPQSEVPCEPLRHMVVDQTVTAGVKVEKPDLSIKVE